MDGSRWGASLALLAIVLIGAAGIAAGHETTTVDGYELTFGGADEPVITDERMWMQVEVLDAETGDPVEVQPESVEMAVQRPFGNDTFELPVSGVHGRPGWYEGAVIFTEPGTYTFFISAEIDGETIETSFDKQVHPASTLQYPRSSPESDAVLEPVAALGFGLGAGVTAVGTGVAFVIGRRRRV